MRGEKVYNTGAGGYANLVASPMSATSVLGDESPIDSEGATQERFGEVQGNVNARMGENGDEDENVRMSSAFLSTVRARLCCQVCSLFTLR